MHLLPRKKLEEEMRQSMAKQQAQIQRQQREVELKAREISLKERETTIKREEEAIKFAREQNQTEEYKIQQRLQEIEQLLIRERNSRAAVSESSRWKTINEELSSTSSKQKEDYETKIS